MLPVHRNASNVTSAAARMRPRSRPKPLASLRVALRTTLWGATWMALSQALGGCSSVPTIQWHSLIAPMPDVPRADAGFVFQLAPIAVPDQVDRPELVVRTRDGDSPRILEQQQWVAPMRREFRDALSFQMQARLGARDATQIPGPNLPSYRVLADVTRFESVIGGVSSLQVDWSIRAPDQKTRLACQSVIRFDSDGSIERLVQGHRAAIARLAGQIAQPIEQHARGGVWPPACPAVLQTL